MCGGDGVQLDVDGVCCGPAGVITPSGYCCASGNVDDAGVCDGTGAGVPKTVDMTSVAPFGFIDLSSSRRRLAQTGDEWGQVKASFEQLATARLGYPAGSFAVIITQSSDNTTATVRLNDAHMLSRAIQACASTQPLHSVTLLRLYVLTNDSLVYLRLLLQIEALTTCR